MRRLDVVALEEILTKWVNTVIQSRPDLIDCLKVVAMDGKTMRATHKQDATISHLLSVVSHELGVTLTQRSVSDKTNEIPISTEILEAFDVSGKVITTDALLTQRAFCEKVVDAGGDYVQPVKKNQEFLFWAIETLFQSEDATLATDKATTELEVKRPDTREILDSFQTYDKEHGRLETRCLKASTALNAYLADWPGLAQVIEYRQVRKNMRIGKETYKVQYGRTSLRPEEASAERLLTIRRGHWTIENKAHWVRDVVFREDVSPVRCGAIPQVMAAMQRTAMSVLRFSGYTAIAKATRYFASKPKLAVKLIN